MSDLALAEAANTTLCGSIAPAFSAAYETKRGGLLGQEAVIDWSVFWAIAVEVSLRVSFGQDPNHGRLTILCTAARLGTGGDRDTDFSRARRYSGLSVIARDMIALSTSIYRNAGSRHCRI